VAQAVTPPAGTLQVVDDVAPAFAEAVVDAFARRPGQRFTLVLSGGPTAQRCYEHLAEVGAAAIDWSLVDVLMGDERCVGPDDPDSNQRLVREALLERVAPVGSFRPMSCDDVDSYQRILEQTPVLDLVHLGMGPDGHTASLFAGSSALDAAPGTLATRSSDPNERNPHERMTITLETISRAHLVIFTVAGESKRDAFAELRSGTDLPAARVRAEQVLWLVDSVAAGAA